MPLSTPDSRYVINNDPEGDVEAVSKKRQACELAQKWANEDGITYYVIDRMSRAGKRSLWEFTPGAGRAS